MNLIAKSLLESKAVHIQSRSQDFFTWTSGKRSPIYCDNRQLISHPKLRDIITHHFIQLIQDKYSDVELIAGTATAGIPWAAWIANKLSLPMVYIRSKAKGHGMKSAIEGKSSPSQKTLIIEDLISTGRSSIEAANHAQGDQLDVQAILSIFNYGFQESERNFKDCHLNAHSLCSLDELLDYSLESKLLKKEEVVIVKRWRSGF